LPKKGGIPRCKRTVLSSPGEDLTSNRPHWILSSQGGGGLRVSRTQKTRTHKTSCPSLILRLTPKEGLPQRVTVAVRETPESTEKIYELSQSLNIVNDYFREHRHANYSFKVKDAIALNFRQICDPHACLSDFHNRVTYISETTRDNRNAHRCPAAEEVVAGGTTRVVMVYRRRFLYLGGRGSHHVRNTRLSLNG
jgi:hypothetical protein